MSYTKYWFVVLVPVLISAAAAQEATEPTPTPTPATISEKEKPEKEVQIIVTPNRNPQPLAETASSVSLVTRRQIEQKKPFDVRDVITQTPSVSILQNGARGQLASIFIRGAAPRHNLVLIDGIRINAPSFGGVDFGTFPVENIQQIEVLRGPQSGLYGSDALGGVVNIITQRGEGPFRVGSRLEFGNNSINRQSVTAGGEVGRNRVSFAATRLNSGGFRINEDYKNIGGSLRVDRQLSTNSSLAFIGRAEDAETGVIGSRFFPDPDKRNKVRNLFGGLEFTNQSGRRRDKVTLGLYDRSFQDINPPSPTIGNIDESSLSFNAQSSLPVGQHTLTAGLEFRRDQATSTSSFGAYDKSLTTRAIYLQDEFRSGRFIAVPSVRMEDSSLFGSDLNGRLALAYDVDTRSQVKGSIGTGYRIPHLDFLYYPGFSNPNLQPERSTGFEIGYARQLSNSGRMELTLFRNQFRDLIDSPAPRFIPINVEQARIQGLEVSYDQAFGNGFRAILNHAFLNNKASANQYLVRRPKYISSGDLLYRRGKYGVDLGFVSQGSRSDFGSAGLAQFGGYARFDLTLSYDVRPGLQIYTRAQNLFNKRYEEITGYPAPRFNMVVGMQTPVF